MNLQSLGTSGGKLFKTESLYSVAPPSLHSLFLLTLLFHVIMGSHRLGKTFRIIESNHCPSTAKPTTIPRPQVPHLQLQHIWNISLQNSAVAFPPLPPVQPTQTFKFPLCSCCKLPKLSSAAPRISRWTASSVQVS